MDEGSELVPILSNNRIFGRDLHQAKIEKNRKDVQGRNYWDRRGKEYADKISEWAGSLKLSF